MTMISGICAACGVTTSSNQPHVCSVGVTGTNIQTGSIIGGLGTAATTAGLGQYAPSLNQVPMWWYKASSASPPCPKCKKEMDGSTHTCDTESDSFAKWVEETRVKRQQAITDLCLFVPLGVSFVMSVVGILVLIWCWGSPSMDIGLKLSLTGCVMAGFVLLLKAISRLWFKKE